MKSNPIKIGIFDSGIGGLSILEKLNKKFTNLEFHFIADYAYNPYGIKNMDLIKERTLKISKYLEKIGVDIIVIACNTASVFKSFLIKEINIEIIDMIDVTVEYIKTNVISRDIVLLATDNTIKSDIYRIKMKNNRYNIHNVKASDLVKLIESNNVPKEKIEYLIKKKLQDLKFSVLVLGCTHYIFVEEVFKKLYPNAEIISNDIPLERKFSKIIDGNNNNTNKIHLYTTGNLIEFKEKIKYFDIKNNKINKILIE